MIRNNDFQSQWAEIASAASAVFAEVGASGWYVLGPEVESFERELALRWGLPFAVGVGNGLDAIEIALRALGVGAGDRVLTTPLSAFATTLAIVRTGAVPVFVDVDDAGLIDLDACARALRADGSIRAMVPVHLYGQVLDLERLARLREQFDLRIVEDCAQAIGAAWQGRAVGTVGAAAAVSFYPTKNLGALGDGGALLTATPALAERARRLRHYGQSATYVHDHLGGNSRLDELHAALLGRVFLPRLRDWTLRRSEVAASYLARIDSPAVRLPRPSTGSAPVWHLFPVRVDGARRQAFRAHLEARGIESGVHYPRVIPEQRALAEAGGFEVLGGIARARAWAAEEVSLPVHPFLSTEQVEAVVAAVSEWMG